MKKLLLIVLIILLSPNAKSQKSVDALFSKYSGKDGYVSLTVSGNLLKFSSCHDDDSSMPSSITEIRILAQEDKADKDPGFSNIILRGIDLDDYEEFMRVHESDQDFRMLVKAEGRKYKEFLIVAGGDDNALIQIKGDMSFNEAKKFSKDLRKNNGQFIDMDSR